MSGGTPKPLLRQIFAKLNNRTWRDAGLPCVDDRPDISGSCIYWSAVVAGSWIYPRCRAARRSGRRLCSSYRFHL